jgi:hypothetical protein
MHANWYGLAPDWLRFIPDPILGPQLSEVWYGIIGGKPDFSGVAFSHSEEFVSVYRFHSLLPDNIAIRSHVDGFNTGKSYNISQYAFGAAQNVIHENKFSDVVYTFGVDNPGALVKLRCASFFLSHIVADSWELPSGNDEPQEGRRSLHDGHGCN